MEIIVGFVQFAYYVLSSAYYIVSLWSRFRH